MSFDPASQKRKNHPECIQELPGPRDPLLLPNYSYIGAENSRPLLLPPRQPRPAGSKKSKSTASTVTAAAATASISVSASSKQSFPWVQEGKTEKEYYSTFKCNLEMIATTAEATNKVGRTVGDGFTRLKSINGLAVEFINQRNGINQVFKSLGIPAAALTKLNKKQVCDAIADYKEESSLDFAVTGSDDAEILVDPNGQGDSNTIQTSRTTMCNYIRFTNVLSSEVMKLEWAKKAATKPTRAVLEDKQKAGARFFRIFAQEYNSNKEEYDQNDKYPTDLLDDVQSLQDAADYRPLTAVQLKAAFDRFNKDYKIARRNSQKSGTHGKFSAETNFEDFVKERPYLLYYHGFMKEVGPNIKNTALVELSDDVFVESTSGKSKSCNTSQPLRRKKVPTPASAAVSHVAVLASSSADRAKIYQQSEMVKMEAAAKEAFAQAQEKERQNHKILRVKVKDKHPLMPDEDVKKRSESLIRRAMQQQNGISLSQATDCSSDTINTIATLGASAKNAARYRQESVELKGRLEQYGKCLNGFGKESNSRGKSAEDDVDSDASCMVVPPKRRRQRVVSTGDSDDDDN